jgi:osmoprotectant transport system ATP-binding protein
MGGGGAGGAGMIEWRDVGKRFGAAGFGDAGSGAVQAVDGVSLQVQPGEILVLVGASGSGKSTLLKMANRLVAPDHGQVLFKGQDVRALAAQDLRRRMGYVIQSTGLFPHWTVARNIATVPRLLGWPAARVAARVEELLALLGLEAGVYRDRYPHQLSGGQQQRVGVARALAADPEVLLMDEPFGALDPLTRQTLQGELLRIHRSAAAGKTIVMVTHDIDEALRLAKRIVLLDQGRVVQVGTPLQMLAQPLDARVSAFFGPSDTGLRLLGLQTVAQHMRRFAPGAPPGGTAAAPGRVVETFLETPQEVSQRAPREVPQEVPHSRPAQAMPLSADASLREALSTFLQAGSDRLGVVDVQGRVIGELHFADLLGAAQPATGVSMPMA